MNEDVAIFNETSPKFVAKSPIDNKPSSVQIMHCRRTGDKPLSDLMMTQFSDASPYESPGIGELI